MSDKNEIGKIINSSKLLIKYTEKILQFYMSLHAFLK